MGDSADTIFMSAKVKREISSAFLNIFITFGVNIIINPVLHSDNNALRKVLKIAANTPGGLCFQIINVHRMIVKVTFYLINLQSKRFGAINIFH